MSNPRDNPGTGQESENAPAHTRAPLGAAGRRFLTSKPGVALVALLAVSGLAAAAITLSFSTTTTLTTGVTAVPVQFVAGDDAGPSALSDYVTSYAISANRTYMTAAVKGVPEASLVIGSFFKLQNADDQSRSVTLSTDQVTNAYVSAYTLEIYNPSNVLQGTLTLTAASPSVTFTLPAATTYSAKLTLALASGAGANNVALTNALAMSVT